LRKAEKSVWGWLKGAAGTVYALAFTGSVYALAFHIGCELVKGVLHGLGDLAGKVGGYVVQGREERPQACRTPLRNRQPVKVGGPAYRQAARGGHPRRLEQGIGRFGSMAGAQIKSALTLAYSSVRGPPQVAARSPSRHATRG